MRILSILAAIALFASPAVADNNTRVTKASTVPSAERLPGHEPDTYRFGYPYAAMRGTSPGQCEMMCNRDDSCSAWSYVPATFQMGPRCELKQSVGSQSYRPGAVSGIANKYHPVPRTTIQPKAVHPASRPVQQPIQRPAISSAPPVRTTRPAPQPMSTRPAEPYPMRELLGGPTSVTSGTTVTGRVTRPAAPAPQPSPAPTVYPQTSAPRQLTQAPNAVMRRPAPTPQAAPQPVRQAPPPPPARPVPQFQMVPPEETAPAPVQSAPVATAPMSSGGVSITPAAPIQNRRKPWTERSNGDPAYSVSDSGFIPGDEEATAGFVDGLPEADDE